LACVFLQGRMGFPAASEHGGAMGPETSLFTMELGLQAPWSVTDVRFDAQRACFAGWWAQISSDRGQ